MTTQMKIAGAALALLAGPVYAAEPITESDLLVIDTNGDGAVSQAEYTAYMARAFTTLDVNGDGALQASELAATLTREQFTGMDLNGDGTVSRAEFDKQVMDDFAAADRGGDGALQ